MCGLEGIMLVLTLQQELLKTLAGDRYNVTAGYGERDARLAKLAETEATLKKCRWSTTLIQASKEGVK